MNYVACNCCPTPVDCGFDQKCWNQRVTQANLKQIHTELAKYDAMVAARPVWVPDAPVKPVKPYCGHLQRSEVGICLACGDWL